MAERGGVVEGLMALECSAVTQRDESLRLAKASAGLLVCWASSSAIGAAGRWLQQVAVQSAMSSEVAGLNGATGEAAAMGRDGNSAFTRG